MRRQHITALHRLDLRASDKLGHLYNTASGLMLLLLKLLQLLQLLQLLLLLL